MAKTSIQVDHIARVEGHGNVHVVIEDGAVKTCEMVVTEPARLFESMVRGRPYADVAYICSRICGICSPSHVVTDILACEDAFGVRPSERTGALRELLVYGSYLQNHATHLFVFAAPDFLGMQSVFPLAEVDRGLFEKALALKALGNELCTKVGGRQVHPITAVVGGFTSEPLRSDYLELAGKLDAAVPFALSCVDLFDSFPVPQIETAGDMLAMAADEGYPVCTSGDAAFVQAEERFDAADVEDVVEEYESAHSGALFARRAADGRPYFTGALARLNASWSGLCHDAKVASAKVGLRPPERNPFLNNVAQAVEIVDALERCAGICRRLALGQAEGGFDGSSEPVSFTARAAMGVGFTEAPRGALFHKLAFDDDGCVERANIVTPTAQNVACLEADMRTLAEHLVGQGCSEESIRAEIEKLVRAYDPCFSCSVH